MTWKFRVKAIEKKKKKLWQMALILAKAQAEMLFKTIYINKVQTICTLDTMGDWFKRKRLKVLCTCHHLGLKFKVCLWVSA